MKKIQLTQGQFALVDDWWFDYLNQWKWQAVWSKDTNSFYAARTSRNEQGKRYKVSMNRVVAKTPKGLVADHIDHNTLNNQEHNLRNITFIQNLFNRKGARSDNKSTGILGVSRHSKGFRAKIQIDGKEKCFPVRYTLEEAIEDRKQAEILYYGEFRGDAR